MKPNAFCQSCGMPIEKDPQHGGTEADGTINSTYCSLCYANSAFRNPEIDTPQKMQKFCIQKMKEQKIPGFVAWIFTRSIPKLERWKKQS